jgi:BirA family biotin operon repressor/biotin-[acetyl-CoA-carboxylase] ligase
MSYLKIMPISKTSHYVLDMLANGDSLSGESIGKKLGISRMAISKAIKGLTEQGLSIASVPGKGYQLESPVQLLDKEAICSALSETGSPGCHIEVLQQVESTSDYVLQQSRVRDVSRFVCLAETQSSGRGRRQRQWHASPYRNVVLSIGWRFDDGMSGLSGLGIAAGITIARTLHEAGFDRNIGLKWPNDIVWNDSKLGGLLIDVRGEHDGPCLAVLGLGLNLALSEEDQQNIDQACVSLEQITNDPIDRNSILTDMIRALTELFESYSSSDFARFHRIWPDYDRLHGRDVKVIRGETSFSGVAMGIDELGALLLDEGKGPFTRFFSGDVSLRLAR